MKIFEGIVISIGMNKTAIVEVSRRTPHPLYKKLIKRSKKYKADIASFEPQVGNIVRIIETRPMSKDKYFKITKILGETVIKKGTPAIDEVLEEAKPARKSSGSKRTTRSKSSVAPADAKALAGKKAKEDK